MNNELHSNEDDRDFDAGLHDNRLQGELNMPESRGGFRWINLIFGVLGLLILASIALTVIGILRERSHLTHCQNNLRLIGLATHVHHDVNKRLPSSTLGANTSSGAAHRDGWNSDDPTGNQVWHFQQNTSSLGQIATYLDIEIVKEADPFLFDFRKSLLQKTEEIDGQQKMIWTDFRQIPGFETVAAANISGLLCPADDLRYVSVDNAVLATQPLVQTTPPDDDIGLKYHEPENVASTGLTNYLANGGVGGGQCYDDVGKLRFIGPLRCRGRMTLEQLADLDGAPYTIMIGENTGQIENGMRISANGWFTGGHGRGRGDIPWGENYFTDNNNRRVLGTSQWSSIHGFGSKHVGGVTFVYADSSVHTLTRETDLDTLYALFGANDGMSTGF